MEKQSLMDVMRQIAGGDRPAASAAASGVQSPSELELFMQIDGLLAGLERQYRDAKADHGAAIREYGSDSPMTEIAASREDSAWCARETRLMELRGDGALMQLVQKRRRIAEQKAAQDKKTRERRDIMAFIHYSDVARQMDERSKMPSVYEWLILFYIYHWAVGRPFPGSGLHHAYNRQAIAA